MAAYPALGSLSHAMWNYVDLRYPNGFAVRVPDYKPKPIKPGVPKPAAAKPATPKPAGATTDSNRLPQSRSSQTDQKNGGVMMTSCEVET